MEEETVRIIMAALSTLHPHQLTNLTHSILSLSLRRLCRLSSLLSSPSLFSVTLHHLHSLSLPHKTLLLSKHLLSSLHLLTLPFHPSPPPRSLSVIKTRDFDSVILLLLLCDVRHYDPGLLPGTPHDGWRRVLSDYCSDTMLNNCNVGVHYGGVLLPYVEMVIRCWGFVGAMGTGCGWRRDEEGRAAPATVVALPTVEVKRGGGKCVICREEMREGRDVCELPCEHLFHWMCILPWLSKKNTCPCCRFQLPTEDVFGEIQRLWGVLIKIGCGAISGGKKYY